MSGPMQRMTPRGMVPIGPQVSYPWIIRYICISTKLYCNVLLGIIGVPELWWWDETSPKCTCGTWDAWDKHVISHITVYYDSINTP